MTHPLVIVGCGKSKRAEPTAAADMYTGPYVKAAVAWARSVPAMELWILSAKHGLIPGHTIIAPYDVTFSHATWARQLPPPVEWFTLRRQVEQSWIRGRVMVLAGRDYYRALDTAAGDLIQPHNPFADEAARRWQHRGLGHQHHLLNAAHGHIPDYHTEVTA